MSVPVESHRCGHSLISPENRTSAPTAMRTWVFRPIFPYSQEVGLRGENWPPRLLICIVARDGSARLASLDRPRVIWMSTRPYTDGVMSIHDESTKISTRMSSGDWGNGGSGGVPAGVDTPGQVPYCFCHPATRAATPPGIGYS